jgi:hypothetical protein
VKVLVYSVEEENLFVKKALALPSTHLTVGFDGMAI